MNMYKLPQGQIVDYMVDYDTSKSHLEAEHLLHGSPVGEENEQIHNDHIGEYKSEFTKI